MSLYSFGLDYPDPQEQHEYLEHIGTERFRELRGVKNPKFDALVAQANKTVNFNAPMALHRRAENVYLNDYPIIPLYNPIATWLAKPYVHGFKVTPLYMTRWMNVSINK